MANIRIEYFDNFLKDEAFDKEELEKAIDRIATNMNVGWCQSNPAAIYVGKTADKRGVILTFTTETFHADQQGTDRGYMDGYAAALKHNTKLNFGYRSQTNVYEYRFKTKEDFALFLNASAKGLDDKVSLREVGK